MKDILLITPPFTQLNTPYPATAYLKGFLNTKQISSYQMDLGIEVILALFSKQGLHEVFAQAEKNEALFSENSQRIFALKKHYINTIDPIIAFLQNKNQALARLICTPNFLPRASRFDTLTDLDWAFGNMGMQDKAKHLATLYLEDISDFIVACIDEHFGFSRYAERMGRSANSFDVLHQQLQQESTYIDSLTLKLLQKQIEETQPKLICFSVPFPGNLYSAFRCAQSIKTNHPGIKVVMGGGFPNTELRSLTDVRVFDFFDFICLDDGEMPLEFIYQAEVNPDDENLPTYKRTFLRRNNTVVYENSASQNDYKFAEKGTPDYSDLHLDKYISVIEITNPMHSIWTDGLWNKLTMTHGCYWAKCTFCDVSLDYIKVFDPQTASGLVDQMEQLMAQTGNNGFHFVDEAANPSIMRALALEIIKRNLTLTWWTNIRFEKSFSADLCLLLKASGCIAVSGGLEVASDRLLGLINKGVTVNQVAQVTHNFTQANIMVHAYLMYGYPTQTIQETIDSLEMVRQLFELGLIQSAFWHQFALTAHSPIGMNPDKYNITPTLAPITFANNDIQFTDSTGIDHDKFSFGLKKSLYNFMHDQCFDYPLQQWFDFKIPQTKVSKDFIKSCLHNNESFSTKSSQKIIWLGNTPLISEHSKSKKGETWQMLQFTFHDKAQSLQISLDVDKGRWFAASLESISVYTGKAKTFEQLKNDFENHFEDFELFWYSKPLLKLKKFGLLVL